MTGKHLTLKTRRTHAKKVGILAAAVVVGPVLMLSMGAGAQASELRSVDNSGAVVLESSAPAVPEGLSELNAPRADLDSSLAPAESIFDIVDPVVPVDHQSPVVDPPVIEPPIDPVDPQPPVVDPPVLEPPADPVDPQPPVDPVDPQPPVVDPPVIEPPADPVDPQPPVVEPSIDPVDPQPPVVDLPVVEPPVDPQPPVVDLPVVEEPAYVPPVVQHPVGSVPEYADAPVFVPVDLGTESGRVDVQNPVDSGPQLAYTGVDEQAPVVAIGGGLLLAGVGAVAASRRSRRNTEA